MNILVVNDDGVKSKGLTDLVLVLSEHADVYVCAPISQRSAASHAITLTDRVLVRGAVVPGAEKVLVTSGTPADCTKIGLQFFGAEGVEFDLVYSGINLGSNLGIDTLYSGTVGAAREGAISGVPAVAVSVDSHQAERFDVACKLAADLVELLPGNLPEGVVLNLNVPYIPREEMKGIRYTHLGGRFYKDGFVLQADGSYRLEGDPEPEFEGSLDCDLDANDAGYVTISLVGGQWENADLTRKRLGKFLQI